MVSPHNRVEGEEAFDQTQSPVVYLCTPSSRPPFLPISFPNTYHLYSPVRDATYQEMVPPCD